MLMTGIRHSLHILVTKKQEEILIRERVLSLWEQLLIKNTVDADFSPECKHSAFTPF